MPTLFKLFLMLLVSIIVGPLALLEISFAGTLHVTLSNVVFKDNMTGKTGTASGSFDFDPSCTATATTICGVANNSVIFSYPGFNFAMDYAPDSGTTNNPAFYVYFDNNDPATSNPWGFINWELPVPITGNGTYSLVCRNGCFTGFFVSIGFFPNNVVASGNAISGSLIVTGASSSFMLSVSETGNGIVTSVPSGINCGSTCGASFTAGTQVTLTATPATGWSFSNWGGACGGSQVTCVVTMDAAQNATAVFSQNSSKCVQIISPTDGDEFPQTVIDPPSTAPVTFAANTPLQCPPIVWTLTLQYQTSGGRPSSGPLTDVRTRTGASFSETYQGVGGQLQAQAASGTDTDSVTVTITGAQIPDSDLSEYLKNIYEFDGGATPYLMTGIAKYESEGYRQFSERTLYDVDSLWPYESDDGGSHIGLMQVPITDQPGMELAWDWQMNGQKGESIFLEKLALATRIMGEITARHPGLTELSGEQLENMALVLYGPGAYFCKGYSDPNPCKPVEKAVCEENGGVFGRTYTNLNAQYYVPQRTMFFGWEWVVNEAGNPVGVCYAQRIRNDCVPAGSCPPVD